MKRNYLLFIIDSLNYSHIKESSVKLMPFFEELKSKGICCENMYSQAPYTEAAVMNLYCGQDVLQNNGYIFRFKNAKTTIFEEMKKAGYITYYNSYQPQCHPSSVRRGVDYLYYNVGYDQDALWSYRLQHFSDLYKAGCLTQRDYQILQEIFDDNFSEWIRFTNDIINKDESTNMIIDNAVTYNAVYVKNQVSDEKEQYNRDKKKYIQEVLSIGKKHRLFRIPAFEQNNKIKNRALIKSIQIELKPLLKRIQRLDTRLNLKNCKGLFLGPKKKLGELVKRRNRTAIKDFLKSCYLTVNQLIDIDLFDRINKDCDWFKNAPSGKTHIDHYIKWAKEHVDDGKHFACIHIDDIHNPEEFFTYDTEDISLIKEERKYAEELLDSIPKDYYGSLTHDLSLRFIDNTLRYLYKRLDEFDLLSNTCIAICADHGFSFSGNPLRDSFVTNLYLENYLIPCVFTGTGLNHKEIQSLRTSKDIPATLCKLATGSVPENFTGHSLTEDFEYPTVQIEYCGGGCPDLFRRELKIASFNKNYFVGTLCSLDEKLEGEKITEIYDLNKDPRQLNNLVGCLENEGKVENLLVDINSRRKEILSTRC